MNYPKPFTFDEFSYEGGASGFNIHLFVGERERCYQLGKTLKNRFKEQFNGCFFLPIAAAWDKKSLQESLQGIFSPILNMYLVGDLMKLNQHDEMVMYYEGWLEYISLNSIPIHIRAYFIE